MELIPTPAEVRKKLEANRSEAKMLRRLLKLAIEAHGPEESDRQEATDAT